MLRVFILVILFILYSFAQNLQKANTLLEQKKYSEAIKIYNELAINGNNEAVFKMGVAYYKKKDLKNAVKYFKIASSLDIQKAKYNLATIYSQKNSDFYNPRVAHNLFLDLAQKGDAKAQNKLGLILLYGIGVEKDYKKAVRWFELSYFEGNYLQASCNLAYMFAEGKGVFFNFGRARELAQKGYDKKLPRCVKVYKEYKLHKYDKDRGFKFGYYN